MNTSMRHESAIPQLRICTIIKESTEKKVYLNVQLSSFERPSEMSF